ncbi:MAG TPA: N-acetyltransferase [Candidatus Desulfofervidus auxilii]|uniref:N-acetyltransferase n=1 Tax=Desulfofervidus auxilii TaxID=1621989 RepID=A0A7C0U161_DESA2|nr:N-acetyltransferase [Candidatus Desulfofervidus auxilii]
MNYIFEKAKIKDTKIIYEILTYYGKKGLLLPRPLSEIYEFLRDFFVCRQGNEVIGICALHIFWENLAEIRSLAVKEAYQHQGIGKHLVQACLQEAVSLGIFRVFTLTYKPNFFSQLGFKKIEKESLPHKIWADCIRCPKYPDLCDEISMIWEFKNE